MIHGVQAMLQLHLMKNRKFKILSKCRTFKNWASHTKYFKLELHSHKMWWSLYTSSLKMCAVCQMRQKRGSSWYHFIFPPDLFLNTPDYMKTAKTYLLHAKRIRHEHLCNYEMTWKSSLQDKLSLNQSWKLCFSTRHQKHIFSLWSSPQRLHSFAFEINRNHKFTERKIIWNSTATACH